MQRLTIILLAVGFICACSHAELVSFYEFGGDYSNTGSGFAVGEPMGNAEIVIDSVRGSVLCLDGESGSYVDIGNDDLGGVTTEITVATWLKCGEGNSNYTQVVGKAYNWRLYLRENGTVVFQCMDTQPQGTTIKGTIDVVTDGQWHHVAGTYDGEKYMLYIDGEQDGEPVEATGPVINNTSHVFALGAFVKNIPEVKREFNGCIDDVGIYDHAISLSEIRDIVFPPNASLPQPLNGAIVGSSLQEIRWLRPLPRDPSELSGVLCDVYFGTDPNEASPTFSFDKIEDRLDGDSTGNFAKPLAAEATYYWRVDCYDPNNGGEILTEGPLWSFSVGNLSPVVWAGDDKIVRLVESTITIELLDATVEDDGLPTGSTLSQLWSVESKPDGASVVFDPDDDGNSEQSAAVNPAITIEAPGTYVLRLTASDEDLTHSDQVTIEAPTCASAIGAGFQLSGDLDGDCDVDLADLAILSIDWMTCNDPQNLSCDRPFI